VDFSKVSRILILDDILSISQAMEEVNVWNAPKHITYCLARNVDDARDMILRTEKFDLWILDHNLDHKSYGETGYDFLNWCIKQCPEYLPKNLISCSASWKNKQEIEALFLQHMQIEK
jgi:hypothetical protein